jgi:hypothetical protein
MLKNSYIPIMVSLFGTNILVGKVWLYEVFFHIILNNQIKSPKNKLKVRIFTIKYNTLFQPTLPLFINPPIFVSFFCYSQIQLDANICDLLLDQKLLRGLDHRLHILEKIKLVVLI